MECKGKESKKERGLDFMLRRGQYKKSGVFSLESGRLHGMRLRADGLSRRKTVKYIQSSSMGLKLEQ